MKNEIVKKLSKYPEIVSMYKDVLQNFGSATNEECLSTFFQRSIPDEWKKLLPQDEDIDGAYTFGLMPTEAWADMLSEKPEIAEAASCFESGRVALVCLNKAEFSTIREYMDGFAGFHWIDLLMYRPELKEEADNANAWKVIIDCCAFAIPYLLAKRPVFVEKFEGYDIWKYFDEASWKYLLDKQPQLAKYKK